MLEFSDKPYRYFPPERIAPIAWLLTLLNRMIRLPRRRKIKQIEISGADGIREIRSRGVRILFTPNHSTHSDSEIFIEAIRKIGLTTQFMAAYDIFLRSRIGAWAMQRMGSFSVDRDASDPKAMAQARAILSEGRHSLTIFPEGNVYLRNDEVTPFHEGAAMLGLRSAKELSKKDVSVVVIPVSIKVTYLVDIREPVEARLSELVRAVDAEVSQDAGLPERVRATGTAALLRNLRQRGIDIPEAEDLAGLIKASASSVLRQLEKKMDIEPRAKDSLIDRVRAARRKIHSVLIDPERAADHKAAELWANEAMVAFRIVSYRSDYVASHPTLDRFAETVEKLEEDIFARMPRPYGPRCAFVRFGRPIDLEEYLESFRIKARVATRSLTERIEGAVQEGIDALNTANPHLGGSTMIA
ncbi:MAG: 1-acyl-sn-glycerol-3-phosphate acyltransferase [Planctomycetota bacterium]|nr:1-acyl-sn-glycerol-3-phosphate acyltransferase [Planctomycetota bacterium]